MMVHFKNAVTTFLTVVSSMRLPGLTSFALAAKADSDIFRLKRRLHTFFDPSRVGKSRSLMTNDCHKTHNIESYEVVSAPSIERDSFDPLPFSVMLMIKVKYGERVCHVLSIKY